MFTYRVRVPTLREIDESLKRYEPRVLSLEGRLQAAVALVLREAGDGAEVLFIERAEREGDPWSGHMAFPGGRREPGDPDLRGAAERETHEEVGVSLAAARYLGRLDDLEGRPRGPGTMVVSAHVYHLPDVGPLVTNHEVREAFWFPVSDLRDPSRHVEYALGPRRGYAGGRFPGILVGEPERHVVWGLTYRFLEVFLDAVGRPLPGRWSAQDSRDAKPGQRSTGSGG